ncbi:MAG: hypothetical protein RBR06_11215 [Desulfuromonadaceae bacterium]|nr:hypothetical protein [Desulfuromonadaceae bacterium]
MHPSNPTSWNKVAAKLHRFSALRRWVEDLLSISLIVVTVSALVLAATVYLDRAKPGSQSLLFKNNGPDTVPAIYQRQDQGHSIEI